MKQWFQRNNNLWFLFLMATAVFLVACDNNKPLSPPTPKPIVTEVPITITTPEATPTTAVSYTAIPPQSM